MALKIRKTFVGLVASVVLATGLLVAPAGVLPGSVGTQKAAACSTSKFRIIWGTVGIRDAPGGNVLQYGYYGQIYEGPSGGTSGGWTAINIRDYIGNRTRYIPQDSREYVGCY